MLQDVANMMLDCGMQRLFGGLRPQPLYVHHYCFQCTNSIIFGDRAVHNARAGIGNSRHYWTAASNLLALVPLDQALLRT